jgi:phosphoribosylglycinamide formyltransferase-1
MNIHPSLLPSFPGLNSQKKALDYGVKVTGCTVHFVDEGLDSGPVIAQKPVNVMDNDTFDTLSERILVQEHILYPYCVKLFSERRLLVEGRRVIVT